MPSSTLSRPTSDSAAPGTRQRVLETAKAEFARYGIAGARVDRIAKEARTSKERVYAYFSSKVELYSHIARLELTALVQATNLDPTDLPGYAATLYDHFTAHPEHYRLITWGRLEFVGGDSDAAIDPMWETISGKVAQIRDAQKAGLIGQDWDPIDVLALITQIATTWAGQPEISAAAATLADNTSITARRAALVVAVELLFPAAAR